MRMVKVKFIVGGANSAFGGFSAGDVLVCSEAMARHLVDDVKCAKYAEQPTPSAVEPAATSRKKGRK